jgi:acyl-CoA synthetase (AMP-forming)/AMP-acid ligase II
MAFLYDPGLWLDVMSRSRATLTGAPNFAFQRCVNKFADIRNKYKTLDLSQLKCVANAAEPIKSSTVTEFTNAYMNAGFRLEAWTTAYGLAENVMYVTGHPHEPVQLQLDHAALNQGRVVIGGDHTLVSLGRPWPGSGIEVKIVHPEDLEECPGARVGEIWVAGPSKAQGYWGLEELTKERLKAKIKGDSREWLRTGDLGFMHQEDLFFCGRRKDLIIVCGQNFYPQVKPHSTLTLTLTRSPGPREFGRTSTHLPQAGVLCSIRSGAGWRGADRARG